MYQNTQSGITLNGFFRGKVLKHLGNGCCKVYIPGVYPEDLSEQPDKLPTAEQIAPLFGGSNKGNGVFSYPNIGSIVVCGFWNGDQNYPFFWGSTQGGPDAQEQYAEARPMGIEKSDVESGDDARVHKISIDKSTVKLWESGHIEIKVVKDRTDNPEEYCYIDFSENGTINIKTSTQIHLESPEIMIDTKTFCLNTQQCKFSVGSGMEINTSTFNLSADSQTDIRTPTQIEINEKSHYVISPVIEINAKKGAEKFKGSGSVVIAGKTHTPIFL